MCRNAALNLELSCFDLHASIFVELSQCGTELVYPALSLYLYDRMYVQNEALTHIQCRLSLSRGRILSSPCNNMKLPINLEFLCEPLEVHFSSKISHVGSREPKESVKPNCS